MLELYNFHESTCSQKVRLGLAEKGLKFIDRPLNPAGREHLDPEYLKINPNGVVPTLVHDGVPVIESTVIVEYLDECFPEPGLSFGTPLERARLRAWLHYIDEVPTPSIRVPSLNKTLVRIWAKMTDADYRDYLDRTPLRKHFFQAMGRNGFSREEYDAALERLHSCAGRMAKALKENGGPYIMGQRFSIADICLIPTFDRLVDINLISVWEPDYPEVTTWLQTCAARPSYAETFFPGARLSEKFAVWDWNAALDTEPVHVPLPLPAGT